MNFWLFAVLVYLFSLAAGLGLPALSLLGRSESWGLALAVNSVATVSLLVAGFVVTLVLARRFFPEYWWRAQVRHEDVYEYEGVYFVGTRTTRQKTRITKAVFGVDERMRRWDILCGALAISLALPHLLGGYSMYQAYDRWIPQRPKLAETLHSSALSEFPVLREWGVAWSQQPALAQRVEAEARRVSGISSKQNKDWFRLAQLQLIGSFRRRNQPDETFFYSPGDRVWFDRTLGAQGVASLNRILAKPEMERAGWSRGALALLGFYHLSNHDYSQASDLLAGALAAVGDAEEAGITRFQIVLLAAQAVMLDGRPEEAEGLLETILTDDRLPKRAYALATEHFAGAMRLAGRHDRVPELLIKAEALYQQEKNQGGIARIHLRLAALAVEQRRFLDASRELSVAASLAEGQGDGFTLNLVELLAQFQPGSA